MNINALRKRLNIAGFKNVFNFQGGSSLQALSDHLYLDHSGTIKNPVTFRDFQCPHCLTSFEAVSRLFLHLKLCHKAKKKQNSSSLSSVMLIREIRPTMNMDLDGKIPRESDIFMGVIVN